MDAGPVYRPSVRRKRDPTPFKRYVKGRSRANVKVQRSASTQTRTRQNAKRAIKRAYKGWYQTKGVMGPRFKRGKTVRVNPLLRKGVKMHVESGNVVDNADCVYVGHTFGMHQAMRVVCHAIVKKLFLKHGHTIPDFTATVQTGILGSVRAPGKLNWSYTFGEDQSPSQGAVIAPAANATYLNVGDLLFNAISDVVRNQAITSNPPKEFKLIDVTWFDYYFSGGGDVEPNNTGTKLSGDSIWIKLDLTSKMVLQNRTLAKTGAGDESSMLDVANNPLYGRSYEGWGTGATFKGAHGFVGVNQECLVGHERTGVITFDPNNANYADFYDVLRRPPNARAFGCVSKSTGASLQPGQIRTSYLRMSRCMPLTKYWVLMLAFLTQSRSVQQTTRVPLGRYRFFAFEKKCNTGVDEPTMSVGYELNSEYGAFVWEKPCVTSVYNQIL